MTGTARLIAKKKNDTPSFYIPDKTNQDPTADPVAADATGLKESEIAIRKDSKITSRQPGRETGYAHIKKIPLPASKYKLAYYVGGKEIAREFRIVKGMITDVQIQ